MSTDKINPLEKEFNLKEIIFYYLSYQRLIFSSFIICLIIAGIHIWITPKSYEAKTSVLIKQSENGASELAMMEDLGYIAGKNIIEDEIQILKSPDLVRSAIEAANYNVKYSTPGFLRKNYTETPPIVISLDKNSGNTSFQIKISAVNSDGKMVYNIKTIQDGDIYTKQTTKFPDSVNYKFGVIKLLQPDVMNLLKGEEVITVTASEKMAVSMAKSLIIEPAAKNTNVLNISINAHSASSGRRFLQSLVERYNQQAEEDKNQIARNTAIFIDERVKSLSKELSDVEKGVEEFKSSHKITDITSEANLFLTQTSSNEKDLKEAQTQLNIIEYVEEFIHKSENKDNLIPNLGITDPGLSTLVNKYNELLLERERLEKSTTTNNPLYESVLSRLNSMRDGIQNSIISVRSTIEIKKNNLTREGSITSEKILQIPHIEREFLEIKRQQQIKESLYIFLLQKREETSLTLAATAPKGKIISRPRSSSAPVAPKPKIVLIVAALIGLSLPIGFIYLRDSISSRIHGKSVLLHYTNLPIIGEIFHNRNKENIIINNKNHSYEAETFRTLRSSLLSKLTATNSHVVAVTSSIQGEGKTFVCVNLAESLALIRKKVLIVGLDIRNPQIANSFKIQSGKGIADCLYENLNVDDLIVPSIETENLHILQGGSIPPNPNELLNLPKLDEIFNYLRTKYEYIIVDTPPIGIISDAMLINRIVDYNLYIFRNNYTKKEYIEFLNSLHKEQKLKNIQIVLNDVNIESKHLYGNYGHYYKYYYHQPSKKVPLRRKIAKFFDL